MKKKIFYLCLVLLSVIVVFILSIGGNENAALDSKEQQTKIKFESISVNELVRMNPSIAAINTEYPEVTPYLLAFCYGVSLENDSTLSQGLRSFSKQTYIAKTEKEIEKRNANLPQHKFRIQHAFNRLKGTFNKIKTPKEIVFTNSNFNYNATCYNQSILVGLERYIGGDQPLILESLNPSDFPEWIRNGMNEKFMDRDILSAWISTRLVKETTGYHIAEMIRWGKIHVITEISLRIENKDVRPEEILRWSKSQYDWALKNEKKFYKYLMDENLLFDSNEKNRAYLINNGPYTIGLPEESPDRMGQFLGYQIVRNYVLSENLSLLELIDLKYNTILKTYQPES